MTVPVTDGTAAVTRPATRALAAVLIVVGVLHFVTPRFFREIVPTWAGNAKVHVAWSGVAELVAGALLLDGRTRRAGGWLALGLLSMVWPANIQMALDAGAPRTPWAAALWVRVPLQLPMLAEAWRAAHHRPA